MHKRTENTKTVQNSLICIFYEGILKMKRKKLYVIAGIILFLFISLYNLPEYTSEGAIRKYVFLKGNIFEAFTLSIGSSGYVDGGKLGKQYFVNGVTDEKSGGGSLSFFYLKKDKHGKWYVSSCGSGP